MRDDHPAEHPCRRETRGVLTGPAGYSTIVDGRLRITYSLPLDNPQGPDGKHPQRRPSSASEAGQQKKPALAPPEGRSEGEWVPLAEVRARYPGVHKDTILKHAPVERPGEGYLGSRSVYVWLDDEVVQVLRQNARSLS